MTNVSLADCLENEELLLGFREYCKLHRELDSHRLSALIFLSTQADLAKMSAKNIEKLHAKFLNTEAPKDIGYDPDCLIAEDFVDLKFWLLGILIDAFTAFQKSDFFKLSRKRGFVSPPLKVRKRGVLRRPYFEHDSDEWFHMHISGQKLST